MWKVQSLNSTTGTYQDCAGRDTLAEAMVALDALSASRWQLRILDPEGVIVLHREVLDERDPTKFIDIEPLKLGQ